MKKKVHASRLQISVTLPGFYIIDIIDSLCTALRDGPIMTLCKAAELPPGRASTATRILLCRQKYILLPAGWSCGMSPRLGKNGKQEAQKLGEAA